ncbi:MAG: hypothetical protein ORN24_02675 [Burkholderiales bacterium]|nr:hypothetical protein [Burkholderiales bacterium]
MVTTKKVASNAGKVLKNGKQEPTSKVKSAAGSALAQTPSSKKTTKRK